MSDLTPFKGISQADGLAAIEVLKEKISEEGYLFREPTDDVLVKKGRVWSSKDIQKFNTNFVGKEINDAIKFGWIDHQKEGGVVTVVSIGNDDIWVDGIASSAKGRYKSINSKICIELCHQITGKGYERFSIAEQGVQVGKYFMQKYELADAGGAKDVSKTNPNDPFLIMNIIFCEEFKEELKNIFVNDGRQAIDSSNTMSAKFRFFRRVYSRYQSESEYKNHCNLLQSSIYDEDNGLQSSFFKKLNLASSKRYV